MQEIWVQVDVWNRYLRHFPSGGVVMNLPADTVEKGKATYCSILAWRITWRDDPGRLQSMGLQKVGHDGVTFTFFIS